jgi:2-dehydro-3-deoxyphosphogluconate aldolase/(4S)-4-hydroxy-2-oxoglutarate aldolase
MAASIEALDTQLEMVETFKRTKLIPVVVIDDPANAMSVGKALVDGGLPLAEITLRTARALESLRKLSAELPELYVGAGTVLNKKQAIQAKEAGAKFIVSPGFNPSVVEYCLAENLGVLPGVLSASEIEMGLEAGLKLLKIFPIEPAGGIAYLNAIGSVFTDVEFSASGGITADNYLKYLALRNVVAAGVLWPVARDLIAGKQFDRIKANVAAAVSAVAAIKAG